MTGGPLWRSHDAITVLGTGEALPGDPLPTADLLDRIARKFGAPPPLASAVARKLAVATRHHARAWARRGEGPEPGRGNPDLAATAIRTALADAGLTVADLGFVIGHTATPARPLPANIALVADRLGYGGPFLELRQACTGFASALVIAFGLLARPDAPPVAIVGSEVGSVFLDPADLGRDTGQLVNLLQMGDGARQAELERFGLAGQAGIGMLLGLVWSPCVGPTLGTATVLAAQGKDLAGVASVMAAFGTGIASVLVALALMTRSVLNRWRGRLISAGGNGRRILGATIVAVGALILTGGDHILEGVILQSSPDWLTSLTTAI